MWHTHTRALISWSLYRLFCSWSKRCLWLRPTCVVTSNLVSRVQMWPLSKTTGLLNHCDEFTFPTALSTLADAVRRKRLWTELWGLLHGLSRVNGLALTAFSSFIIPHSLTRHIIIKRFRKACRLMTTMIRPVVLHNLGKVALFSFGLGAVIEGALVYSGFCM